MGFESAYIVTYTDQFLFGLLEFIQFAKWLLLCGLCLTMADLKWGLAKARYLEEEIRKSRAARRTLQKITDYIMWIIVAYTIGKAFEPFSYDVAPLVMLIVIYGIEIESIYKNYFASKGKTIRINYTKIFGKKSEFIEIKEDDNETN